MEADINCLILGKNEVTCSFVLVGLFDNYF